MKELALFLASVFSEIGGDIGERWHKEIAVPLIRGVPPDLSSAERTMKVWADWNYHSELDREYDFDDDDDLPDADNFEDMEPEELDSGEILQFTTVISTDDAP